MFNRERVKAKKSFEDTVASYAKPDLGQRHADLDARFKADPAAAMVLDEAVTSSIHVPGRVHAYGQVTPGHYGLPPINMGAHEKVGGEMDFPNPGELLCVAIASCFDSTVRFISCRLGVELVSLSVHVKGNVDVRGTLRQADVPVAFQDFTLGVAFDAGPGVPKSTVQAILNAAEQSCVVMQTIRHSPAITAKHDIAG